MLGGSEFFIYIKVFIGELLLLVFFIKGSARVVEPPRMEYKGFKYKYSLRGNICRSWIIRVNHNKHNKDASTVRFNDNSGIIIKKKK